LGGKGRKWRKREDFRQEEDGSGNPGLEAYKKITGGGIAPEAFKAAVEKRDKRENEWSSVGTRKKERKGCLTGSREKRRGGKRWVFHKKKRSPFWCVCVGGRKGRGEGIRQLKMG